MCLSCGCGQPSDAHGNSDHIVISDLERAAEAANISVEQAADNIKTTVGEYASRSRPVLNNQGSDAGPG
jgi:hypothetical protein